jgi:hypothetical protein
VYANEKYHNEICRYAKILSYKYIKRIILFLISLIIYPLRILLIYLTMYELTPWCTVILEQLIIAQLLKNFSVFYVLRTFILVFPKPAIDPYPEPNKSNDDVLLGLGAIWTGWYKPIFRRSVLSSSSGLKSRCWDARLNLCLTPSWVALSFRPPFLPP